MVKREITLWSRAGSQAPQRGIARPAYETALACGTKSQQPGGVEPPNSAGADHGPGARVPRSHLRDRLIKVAG